MNELIIPQKAEFITEDIVDCWYTWYEGMAARTLEDTDLCGNEREYEVCRRMLEFCDAGTAVNDAVRDRVLNEVARYQLYRYAPEGWETLSDMIREVLPGVTSRGYAHELATVAEIVAPFCERHGIDVYEEPGKLGYIREAASGLRSIITGSAPESVKADLVHEKLEFILRANSRQEVREHFRNYRGIPGTGTTGQLGAVGMMSIVAPPETIAAIRQRIGRLVEHWDNGEVHRKAIVQLSKIEGQAISRTSWSMEHQVVQVVDAETGEVIGEVLQ